MANYPDRRSAALPALAAAQRVHGWCSPEAIEQVACVMRVTPAYLESVASFYDMLETSPVGRHSVYVCTNISCSLCGADELYAAMRDAAAAEPDAGLQRALVRVPRRVRHRADGVRRRRLRRPAHPRRRAAAARRRPRRAPGAAREAARARLVADPRANTREFPEHPPEGGG